MPVLKIVADEAGLSKIGVRREDNPDLFRIVDAVAKGKTVMEFAKESGVDTSSKVALKKFYLGEVQAHKNALKSTLQRVLGDKADVEIEWPRFRKVGGGRTATRKVQFRSANVLNELLAMLQ